MAAEHGAPQFGNRDAPPGYPDQKGSPPLTFTPQLTPEEMQAIKECNQESFMYRCLPYSAVLMATTHVAVMKGFLKPHPTFGPLFKNLGAVFAGYILGKMSYQGACRDKILKLQNSPLAEAMRRRQQGLPPLPMQAPSTPEGSPEIQSNYVDQSRLNEVRPDYDLDSSRAQAPHAVENTNRPSLDDSVGYQPINQESKGQSYTSYDDLRRKNREGYERKMSNIANHPDFQRKLPAAQEALTLPPRLNNYDTPPANAPSSSMYAPNYSPTKEGATQRDEAPPTRGPRQRRNKYGDLIADE